MMLKRNVLAVGHAEGDWIQQRVNALQLLSRWLSAIAIEALEPLVDEAMTAMR